MASAASWAAKYTSLGWCVIPIHGIDPNGHCTCHLGGNCESAGKHPTISSWETSYFTDPETAAAHFEDHPHLNIGIVAGPSQLAILDIDSAQARDQLIRDIGKLPKTPTVKTGNGWHFFYADIDRKMRPKVGRGTHRGIDLRAGPSFVVAPPSRHASGHVYKWVA
jgi:hypothetical protein